MKTDDTRENAMNINHTGESQMKEMNERGKEIK